MSHNILYELRWFGPVCPRSEGTSSGALSAIRLCLLGPGAWGRYRILIVAILFIVFLRSSFNLMTFFMYLPIFVALASTLFGRGGLCRVRLGAWGDVRSDRGLWEKATSSWLKGHIDILLSSHSLTFANVQMDYERTSLDSRSLCPGGLRRAR